MAGEHSGHAAAPSNGGECPLSAQLTCAKRITHAQAECSATGNRGDGAVNRLNEILLLMTLT